MASYSQIALSISDSETKTPNFSAYDAVSYTHLDVYKRQAMDSTAIFFTIENDFRFMFPPPLTFVYHTP